MRSFSFSLWPIFLCIFRLLFSSSISITLDLALSLFEFSVIILFALTGTSYLSLSSLQNMWTLYICIVHKHIYIYTHTIVESMVILKSTWTYVQRVLVVWPCVLFHRLLSPPPPSLLRLLLLLNCVWCFRHIFCFALFLSLFHSGVLALSYCVSLSLCAVRYCHCIFLLYLLFSILSAVSLSLFHTQSNSRTHARKHTLPLFLWEILTFCNSHHHSRFSHIHAYI